MLEKFFLQKKEKKRMEERKKESESLERGKEVNEDKAR